MANIKDVAKRAGVGLGTVSRHLNGHNVTEENRQKIEQAIQELGFKVDPIARSMITKKSMTIAVVVPRLSNMFTMRIMESIETHLEAFGYSTIVCDCSGDPGKELQRLTFCMEKRVDGIVLISSHTELDEILPVVKNTPVVLVDRTFGQQELDSVTVENYEAAYKATSDCINKGHKRFVVLAGPSSVSTARERLAGVLQAHLDHQLPLEQDCIYQCNYETVDGYRAMKLALDKRPDAIFASNYELTIGAIKALNEAKVTCGEEITLIGFDNLELVDVYPFGMTVIQQPMESIGHEAAKCLLARMENNHKPVKRIVLKNEIVRT